MKKYTIFWIILLLSSCSLSFDNNSNKTESLSVVNNITIEEKVSIDTNIKKEEIQINEMKEEKEDEKVSQENIDIDQEDESDILQIILKYQDTGKNTCNSLESIKLKIKCNWEVNKIKTEQESKIEKDLDSCEDDSFCKDQLILWNLKQYDFNICSKLELIESKEQCYYYFWYSYDFNTDTIWEKLSK